MRKTLTILGVLACAVLLTTPAVAGDCDGMKKAGNDKTACATSEVKQASNADGSSCAKSTAKKAEGWTCSKSAAKAAYAKALEESGCEKTAQAAYRNTLAEHAYATSYADTGCTKTAQKAAYEAVYAESGCEKSATTAATHAVAQAAYDESYAKNGCAKTAQAAYEKITKAAGTSCATSTEKAASDCDKGAEAVAEVKMAAKANG